MWQTKRLINAMPTVKHTKKKKGRKKLNNFKVGTLKMIAKMIWNVTKRTFLVNIRPGRLQFHFTITICSHV